jgi:CheY-like chemotaxis protein
MRVREHALEPDSTRRPLILLAEDDADMRQLIRRALRTELCEVLEARDGIQLVRLLLTRVLNRGPDRTPVDLIISDIRMPGANGLDVIAALRCQDTSTPVILITAFGDAETHREAYELGTVMVLNKPFELDDLRVIVRSLIDLSMHA